MKVDSVSNQNFQGKVIGCSWFKPKQREVFKQVKPCLEKLVRNKDYDLKLYRSFGGELRISAGKKPEYAENRSGFNPTIKNQVRHYVTETKRSGNNTSPIPSPQKERKKRK